MNIINKLTLRHLRLNRGRTALTLLAIVLSVAMICAIMGLLINLWDFFRRDLVKTTGDFHIAFQNVAVETAGHIAQEDIFGSYYTRVDNSGDFLGCETDEGNVNIYLRLAKPWKESDSALYAISMKHSTPGYATNIGLLGLDGGVLTGDGTSIALILIAALTIGLVMLGSVTAIANIFNISSSERMRQFGLLKSAGATAKQIGRSVRFEAMFLSVFAIPVGILAGIGLQAAMISVLGGTLKGNGAQGDIKLVFNPWIFIAAVVLSLATVWLSARKSARRAAKAPAIEAIRLSKDIRDCETKLDTSRFVQRMFGFEGTLAAKSLKRNKVKYRAAVISLTVSVIIFITVSALISDIGRVVALVYEPYDYDVLIYTHGDLEQQDSTQTALLSIPDAEIKTLRYMEARTDVPKDMTTQFAKDYHIIDDQNVNIILYSIPDEVFRKLAPTAHEATNGVLINATGKVSINDKTYEDITPFIFTENTTVPVRYETDYWNNEEPVPEPDFTVTISAEITTLPDWLPRTMYAWNWCNIIIPESAFNVICRAEDTTTAHIVTADDPAAFCTAAETILSASPGFKLNNYEQDRLDSENAMRVGSLIGFSFIGLLTLISVTSIIATISTGMALRRQEVAMLCSVGMTGKGLNRMFNLESLLYGLKSLIIGWPVGLALSVFVCIAVSMEFKLVYHPPVLAMLISAAVVLLLTFNTMRYSKRKLRGMNIVEALRSDMV